MPLPGPRNQFGQLATDHNNPFNQEPDFFKPLGYQPTMVLGRTPGTQVYNLHGNVLAAGQIRKMWRQMVNYIPAMAPYSWTANGNPDNAGYRGVGITRALRYMTRSLYMGSGEDNTRFENLHTVVDKQNRYKPVTVGAGNTRNNPTTRNRMTSFGSRAPVLNPPVVGAVGQSD